MDDWKNLPDFQIVKPITRAEPPDGDLQKESCTTKIRLTFSNLRLSWPASYNSVAGMQPAYDGPINTQGDYESVKAKLLTLGPELVSAIKRGTTSHDW